MADQNSAADPFDSLLGLEDQYYTEGYNLGVEDGSRAGRIEGRIFGLEKGFEKYAAMGALMGRSAVWEARSSEKASVDSDNTAESASDNERQSVAPLAGGPRLEKHIERLSALTEAESLPMQNNEEAVNEFDDRFRDATSKATLISKIVGEDSIDLDRAAPGDRGKAGGTRGPAKTGSSGKGAEIEDFSLPRR